MDDFRKAWRTAREAAGVPERHFYDFRRSGLRNMVRAGVDPAVAMKISGHRTRSTFDRYNIVSDDDIRESMTKTAAYLDQLPTEPTVLPALAGTYKDSTTRQDPTRESAGGKLVLVPPFFA